jgi:hypothetical protein
MKGSEDLIRNLRIQDLFAHLTGDDPYLARQIRDAVDASLAKRVEPTEADYQAALDRLAADFGPSPEAGRFTWIDARREPDLAGLLWLRASVINCLKRLARHPEGTLLIANLTDLFRPPGKRWTPSRREAYTDTVAWLRDLVRARSLPHRPVNLLLV